MPIWRLPRAPSLRRGCIRPFPLPELSTSLSTVYRTVGALSEKGLLLKSAGADGVIHYQLNNSRHCHYLICTDCSQVVPVDGCPLHVLEESLSQSTGYHITGHHLEFFGLCPQCAQRKKK